MTDLFISDSRPDRSRIEVRAAACIAYPRHPQNAVRAREEVKVGAAKGERIADPAKK
ncbi:MAG TPA: hypothetical protein VN802_18995 [Stellaceae bacterium]|nr:hypothetical protein [Stellaceae bacterium]